MTDGALLEINLFALSRLGRGVYAFAKRLCGRRGESRVRKRRCEGKSESVVHGLIDVQRQ